VTQAPTLRWGLLRLLQIAAIVALGGVTVPRAFDAFEWASAKEDPSALTELGLKAALTPDRFRSELDAALGVGDMGLAASLMVLAEQQKMEVPASMRERYASANSPAEQAKQGVRDFCKGVVAGEATGGAGLAGVLASDLSGIGDIRDLISEGEKISRGEEADHLVLGLSAIGLAVTGATIASFGAALPERAGITTMRVAAKTGRLSKPLAASVTHLVAEAIDSKAVTTAAKAAAGLDFRAARSAAQDAIRPIALARLRSVAEDMTIIGRRAGVRGAQEALALAQDGSELRRIARLSEARGASTYAILKILGRAAVALTTAGLTLFGWIMAGLGYVLFALTFAVSLASALARAVWRLAARLT
jgi:hypothetical protein